MGLYDEYFSYYKKYQKEYGENTIILIQVGSFYEIYEITEPEFLGNANKVSNVLNFVYTSKNKKLQSGNLSNPNFCGFGITQLAKYLPILIENNFIVIVIDQVGNEIQNKLQTRKVTGIYSGSLQPLDYTCNNIQSVNLVNILIELLPELNITLNTKKYLISLCSINNFTNDIFIEENTFTILNDNFDEIISFIQNYSPRECIIRTLNLEENDIESILINSFKFEKINVDLKMYLKVDYQNEYFKNVYKHCDMGLLCPIEFLNLELYSLSILNFMFSLDFIAKHDINYISNLNIPKLIEDQTFLKLPLNTIQQLHIIGENSNSKNLFSTIDNTSTSIGRRYLKQLLIKPFIDVSKIESRYNLTEKLKELNEKSNDKFLINLEKCLNRILDIERFHRKMGTNTLQPFEFYTLAKCYDAILELSDICINFYEMDKDFLNDLKKFKIEYNFTFDLNKIQQVSNITSKEDIINYFNKGIIELDSIENNIHSIENNIELLRLKYDSFFQKPNGKQDKEPVQFIKVNSTDQEGYFFYCTKIRYNTLLKKLNKDEINKIEPRFTSNMCKIFIPELNKLSNELLLNRDLLNTKIKLYFTDKIKEYYLNYYQLFNYLKVFIEIIDITKSNLKTSLKYNYTKPIIEEEDNSFLEVKDIRHPIIERLTKSTYVTNDIKLNQDSQGILLYGLNSSGKSSLLRAIGMNIILAQCGLYVPSSYFKFSPFKTLISQVDLTDDFTLGKSSFITEMCSLKKILMCSGKNTLVLADELCRGTEHYSATSIVSSTIMQLIDTNSKFFFTSHLHDIPKVKCIKDSNTQINHLSILITENNNIIFERKLKDGSGSDLYGLEVGKSILQDKDFIDKAFEIRNELMNNKNKIMSTKKSKYNSKKIINKCEICNNTEQLETHHIIFQCTADSKGNIKVGNSKMHKNNISNLCTLCKKCHDDVTYNRLIIHGYKDTLTGKYLDYEKVKCN